MGSGTGHQPTGSFDRIDHGVLLSILGEKIHDNRFLRLMPNLIGAGYLEEWTYHATLSGTPQGGVISPILSNIYHYSAVLSRVHKLCHREEFR